MCMSFRCRKPTLYFTSHVQQGIVNSHLSIYLFRWKSPKVLPASDQWKLYSTHSSSWWWRGLWSFSTQLGWSPAGKNQNQIMLSHVTLIIERIGTLKIVLQNKKLKTGSFLQLREESQYQSSCRQLDSFYQIGLFRLVRKPSDWK